MNTIQVWPHKDWQPDGTWREAFVAWLVDDDGEFVESVGESPDHIRAFSKGREYAELHGIVCYMHDELPDGVK